MNNVGEHGRNMSSKVLLPSCVNMITLINTDDRNIFSDNFDLDRIYLIFVVVSYADAGMVLAHAG